MNEQDTPTGAEPRWIQTGAALWLAEIRTLLITMWAFASAPRRFGAEWAEGTRAAMNPIGVVLASATVLLPADYALQQLLRWDRRTNVSFSIEVARAARPYLFAILAGMALHGVLRLYGSWRRMSTTIGLLLYTTALSWLVWCIGLLVCYLTGAGNVLPNILSMCTLAWAALALDGAHRIGWWWCGPLLGTVGFAVIGVVNFALSSANLT